MCPLTIIIIDSDGDARPNNDAVFLQQLSGGTLKNVIDDPNAHAVSGDRKIDGKLGHLGSREVAVDTLVYRRGSGWYC